MSVDTDKNLTSTYTNWLSIPEGFGLASRLVELRKTLAEGAELSWDEAGQLTVGLVTLWLAGSGYGLLKRGVDLFGELLTLHARLSATNGWLEPPDLGQALLELVGRFQPAYLPGGTAHLSPSAGLALCQQLHALHRVAAVTNGIELYAAWLGATDRGRPGQVAPGEIPYFVDDAWSGMALVEAFAGRVAHYQTHNAEALRPALPAENGQLTMFGPAEEVVVAETPVIEDIPARVLADFRAAPGLNPERRLAASLTLWQTALEAYAVKHVSIFNSLPAWELR